MSGSRALLVFAKTPKPGKVKTRLLAAVSAEVAAALHAACIADTLRLARKMRGCDAFLFGGGGTSYFRKLVKEIFREIPWSTERVLELTLKKIAALKLRKRLLRRDFDLDRPEDLERATEMLKRRRQVAPGLAGTIGKVEGARCK